MQRDIESKLQWARSNEKGKKRKKKNVSNVDISLWNLFIL